MVSHIEQRSIYLYIFVLSITHQRTIPYERRLLYYLSAHCMHMQMFCNFTKSTFIKSPPKTPSPQKKADDEKKIGGSLIQGILWYLYLSFFLSGVFLPNRSIYNRQILIQCFLSDSTKTVFLVF